MNNAKVGATRNIQAELERAFSHRCTPGDWLHPPCLPVSSGAVSNLPWSVSLSDASPAAARGLHTAAVAAAAAPSSTAAALNLIRSQPSQYVVAAFAGRKYILTPRDLLTVPHLRDVNVGDVLVLDEIHELGSREYTLRGNPVIPPGSVKVEATVVEHTKGNMEYIFKKKRRKGYRKTIQHKQPYTRLRIGPIEIPAAS